MVWKKRILGLSAWCSLLFCLVVLATVLMCSHAVFAREKVVLRLWNIPYKNTTTPSEIAKRRVFDAFCIKYPDIKVTALVPLRIQGPASEGNEFMAVAGGVAPDVFYLYGRKVGNYRAQGFLYPLNDFLSDYTKQNGKPYSGIVAPDNVWELCYDDKKITCVPFMYYVLALKCNDAIFAKAGLAERVPKDWDEFYRFARHMTIDPSKEPNSEPGDPIQYGLYILTGVDAGWHFLQYVWSGGGDVVVPYYSKQGKFYPVPIPQIDYRNYGIKLSNEAQYMARTATLREQLRKQGLPEDYSAKDLEWRLETDTPKALRALEFFRKLSHQPWLRNGDHEFDITPEMLQSGKAVDPQTGDTFDLNDEKVKARIYHGVSNAVEDQSGAVQIKRVTYAMSITTLEAVNNEDPHMFSLAPFPSAHGEKPCAFIAGHYLAINAAINPEDTPGRQDVKAIRNAAWKYIQYVTGPEAQKIMVKTFAEYGLADYIRPALLKEAGFGDLLMRIPPARRKLWDNLENYSKVEPYCSGFAYVMTRELSMPIQVIINDVPDPKTGKYSKDPYTVMHKTVKNVNSLIMGKMPVAEVKRRSRIGWVIFAIMAVALAMGANYVVRAAMKTQNKAADNEGFGVGGHPARRRLYAWLFLVPAVATIAIWAYYPLVRGLFMAFQDYKILGGSSYTGLRNFVEAVGEPSFWKYLLQTFQYMVMLIGIGFLIPIGLAVLLTEIPKGKILYRTIYYLPAVTTGLVTLFLWKGLMYDQSNNGVINNMIHWVNSWPIWLAFGCKLGVVAGGVLLVVALILQAFQDTNTKSERWISGAIGGLAACGLIWLFGSAVVHGGFHSVMVAAYSTFNLPAQTFLQDPKTAMLWVVLPVIWASAGPGCLIYLAAMKGIPEEQYEAADIDGASMWHKMLQVTYPNLKALIIINLVGAVIGAFKESGNIFVMTGGGPEDATMTTGLYIWYNAFMFLNFGLATAMAWIMGALLIGFTLKQLQILNKLQFRNTAVEEDAKGGGA